jgi:dTDP-glucose 4,6-dehydratase
VYQALTGTPITVYGDGQQTRSFCYVSDLIDGIYKLSQSDEHMPTNIGNPAELTIYEFAVRVLSHFPNAPKIVFEPLPEDDPKQRRPDISKARRLLAWEPKVPLEAGLKLTIDFFKEQFTRTAASR